jgi:hypothetical protein
LSKSKTRFPSASEIKHDQMSSYMQIWKMIAKMLKGLIKLRKNERFHLYFPHCWGQFLTLFSIFACMMTFDHALFHSLMETWSWIWTTFKQILPGQITAFNLNLKWHDFCDVVFTYKKISMFKFSKNLVQMDQNQKSVLVNCS